jgi:hypothetical protein
MYLLHAINSGRQHNCGMSSERLQYTRILGEKKYMWQELRSIYNGPQKERDTSDMLINLDWHSTYMTTWNVPVA